jgi:hypothetical protein
MSDAVHDLIDALVAVEASDEIKNVWPEGKESCAEGDFHPLVQKVIWLADTYLITNNGGTNRANMEKLKAANFPVRKGESDSFGWLSGIIKTSKGDIHYG